MEGNFLDWLDSFGFPFGTWLAIIIGGVTVIGGITVAIIKVKKAYDEKLKNKMITEQADNQFHDSMTELAKSMTNIKTELANILENQQKQNDDINNKLTEVWEAVNKSRTESTDSDNLLSDRIKSYETTIASMDSKLTIMDQKSTLLIESDKEGIKAYIVDKYYQALEDGYINPHSMQTIELRYEKYLQENGNTYIRGLMEKLRVLPNEPPEHSTSPSN